MTGQSPFIHLHVHSEYSLLDGAIRIDKMLKKSQSMEMSAVAVTDHGNMFGAVQFFDQASKAGIKPIIGSELYVAPGDRRDRIARIDVRDPGRGAQPIGLGEDEAAIAEGFVADALRIPERVVVETLDALRELRNSAAGKCVRKEPNAKPADLFHTPTIPHSDVSSGRMRGRLAWID